MIEDLLTELDETAASLELESFFEVLGEVAAELMMDDLTGEFDEQAAALEEDNIFAELENVEIKSSDDILDVARPEKLDELAVAKGDEDDSFKELEMLFDREDELLLVAEPLVPVAEPCSILDEDGCKELMDEAVIPELLEVNPLGPSED